MELKPAEPIYHCTNCGLVFSEKEIKDQLKEVHKKRHQDTPRLITSTAICPSCNRQNFKVSLTIKNPCIKKTQGLH